MEQRNFPKHAFIAVDDFAGGFRDEKRLYKSKEKGKLYHHRYCPERRGSDGKGRGEVRK